MASITADSVSVNGSPLSTLSKIGNDCPTSLRDKTPNNQASGSVTVSAPPIPNDLAQFSPFFGAFHACFASFKIV